MKVAIVCASGIGDALLMQIAACHLQKLGIETTTFSDHLGALAGWFPGYSFARQPALESLEQLLAPFDAVVLEHDNSPKAFHIQQMKNQIYTLYPSYLPSKHGALQKFDFVFNRHLPIALNIAQAINTFFPSSSPSVDNGLTPPPSLVSQKHSKRVAIHPISSVKSRAWSEKRFLALKTRLVERGLEPCFVVPVQEASHWEAPILPTLTDLASFLYESSAFIGNDSGPGHLASNLGLPTITIGPNLNHHLDLWRPGWSRGEICCPPVWTTKTRLTRNKWRFFISEKQVFKQFTKLTELN